MAKLRSQDPQPTFTAKRSETLQDIRRSNRLKEQAPPTAPSVEPAIAEGEDGDAQRQIISEASETAKGPRRLGGRPLSSAPVAKTANNIDETTHEEADRPPSSPSEHDQANIRSTSEDHEDTLSQTPFSVIEIDRIKQNIQKLPTLFVDLDSASTEVLNLLAPNSLREVNVPETLEQVKSYVKSLKQPDSVDSAALRQAGEKFQTVMAPFGGEQGELIHVEYVLRGIFDKDSLNSVPRGSWRPDDILQKANLARLALDFLTLDPDTEEASAMLNRLGQNEFPSLFLNKFEQSRKKIADARPGSSFLPNTSLMLVLEITTQLAIIQLREQANDMTADPDVLLVDLFNDLPPWRFWPDENSDGLKHTRIDDIRRHFGPPDEGRINPRVDLEQLQEQFSWDLFQHDLVRWIRFRTDEIQESLKARGGVTKIQEGLLQQIQPPENLKKRVRNIAKATKALKRISIQSSGMPVTRTRDMAATTETSKQISASAPVAAPVRDQRSSTVLTTDAVTANDAAPSTTSVERPKLGPLRSSGSRKKGHMLDRQENGKTLEFDTQEELDSSQPLRRKQAQRTERGTSPIDATPDEGFQDGAFQTLAPRDRAAAAEKRAELKAAQERANQQKRKRQSDAEGSPAKRTRADRVEIRPDDQVEDEERALSVHDDVEHAPSVHDDAEYAPSVHDEGGLSNEENEEEEANGSEASSQNSTPVPPAASSLPESSIQAYLAARDRLDDPRQKAAVLREMKNADKAPQKRQPWSLEEEKALVGLIAKYRSCSWSNLKQLDFDGNLEDRSQGDLKDKAKIIKFNCLVNGQRLPAGFDKVMLDVKFTRRLEKHGIQYEQKQVRLRD